MTQLKALDKLAMAGGHSILKPEFAAEVGKAFGFKPRLYKITDQRSQFKGAYLPDLKEGQSVKAIDALAMVYQIADHIGYSVKADYFGRGSQFVAAMAELRDHLKANAPA